MKNTAFAQEEKIVSSSVQSEINQLQLLHTHLKVILDTLKQIQTIPINLNITGIDGDMNSTESVAKFIDDFKNSLNGLDPSLLQNLSTILSGLAIDESVATNIQKLANAILNLKSNLNNVSPSSTEFLNSIKELVAQGEALKNLASVLNATKNQLQRAKDAVNENNTSAEDKEALITAIQQAIEWEKREEERIKERNRLLAEGKAQEKAYYDAVNKEREKYIKFWETSLNKQDQKNLKLRGIDTQAVDNELQKTKDLMDQVFNQKQNMQGFKSVFDRAQKEIDNLNNKLKQGEISNIQTGYTDKINKIISDLNKVVTVINPYDTQSAQKAMLDYANTINNGNIKIGNFTNNNKVLTVSFEEQKGVLREVALVYNEVSGAISYVDKGTKKVKSNLTHFVDGIKARFHSLVQYLAIFASYYRIIGYIKEGITVVRDLDTALTEMRKVSDETVESLKNFQDVSFDIAKSVGTTAKQIQNSTADFMRLGESLEQAAESAKVANILLNVSEFEGIDEATDSLVAMAAAYDDLSKMDIVDKLNEVGNNYAISTDGLASALQKSASALTTAGNDMDEAVALVTAGNQIAQDPDSVGAGVRTIALRITGTKEAKEELQELGEDVEDFSVHTASKLQDTIKNFTKVKSNNFQGFDILDDNGNYKSTYEILLGISEIYAEIVETDKQYGSNMANGLLETLAGKNRSNIAASILQNSDILKSAYESSAFDSEGSAQQELDKYLDSIEGKIQLFTNEVQEFWYNLINSDVIKGFVSGATTIMDLLGNIVDKLGVVGTAIAAVGTAYAVNSAKVKSGGRAKYVCPQKVIKICHRIV